MPSRQKNSQIALKKPRTENGKFARTQMPISGHAEEAEGGSRYSPSVESDGSNDTDSAYSEIEQCDIAKKDLLKLNKLELVCNCLCCNYTICELFSPLPPFLFLPFYK